MASNDDPLTEQAPAAPETPKAKKQPPYRKLPGRMATMRLSATGIKSLYLGDDHLLQVDAVFFVEHYKRFAYTDIQTLLLRRTARGWIISLVLAVIVAGLGVLGWSLEEAGRWVSWCSGGFFALLLLINLVRGGTCRSQLETAIGPQVLVSLSRVRPARKAFRLLTERIVAAQGKG